MDLVRPHPKFNFPEARSNIWVLVIPGIFLISGCIAWFLEPVLESSRISFFDGFLRLSGLIIDVVSSGIIGLRLGRRIKSLNEVDVATISSFAIGAILFVVF